jgi:hypothetical protein
MELTVEDAERLHLFTVDEYMASDIPGRTELLGGLIYHVSAKYPPHTRAVRHLTKVLARGLDPDRFEVSVQDPIAVGGWTGRDALEVDVAVIAAKAYDKTPTSDDTFAYIEVSDSTLLRDKHRRSQSTSAPESRLTM